MLYTNLKHIESDADYQRTIQENENVLIICGRMDHLCIPVYRIAEELEQEYASVNFYDMEFDNPQSAVLRTLPEVIALAGIPFTLCYKNGIIVKAISGLQTKAQVRAILDHEFATTLNA